MRHQTSVCVMYEGQPNLWLESQTSQRTRIWDLVRVEKGGYVAACAEELSSRLLP